MKKLLVILAVSAGIVLSGCVGENEMAEPVIFIRCRVTDHYEIKSYDEDGNFVNNWTVTEGLDVGNDMCVDEDGNVYYIEVAGDVIKKYKKDGTLLLSKSTVWSERIAIGPDGYIYEQGYNDNWDECFIKRDPTNLDIIAEKVIPSFGQGFACDEEGYLYSWTASPWILEKWDFETAAVVASHSIAEVDFLSLGIIGEVIGGVDFGDNGFTIPTSLDEDKTNYSLGDSPIGITGVYGCYFAVADYVSAGSQYIIVKYSTSMVKQWQVEVGEGVVYQIAAYPFIVEVDKEAPWKEDTLKPTGEVKVEIPRRSGQWTTLGNVIRIHTSNGKDTSSPRAPVEIGQAEVTCSNIDKDFNSFEEASDWYKNLEGYAVQIKVGCDIGGSPISVKLFTGIISAVDVDRLNLTAEIKVVDFLDYFGRVTIEETPVWENISLTQLFKNLVELAFPEWVEGTDYFVEDLGGSTIPAIGYTDLNLLSELKMIAESRGKRLYTDTSGRLHCAAEPEGEPLIIKHDYNLENVRERRDINSVLNWVTVHARPHEIAYEPTTEPDVLGPDVTPPGTVAAFTATPGDTIIDLSWLNPTDADFDKVRVCFSATAYPLNEEDGTQIYEGTGESKSHTGLTNGKRYYYSAFTKDTTGNWSNAAHTSAIAGAGGDTWEDDMPPSRVSAFRTEPESGKVILTWQNPDLANFSLVRIRRSTTSYPSSPTSGSAVYEGTAETTTDSGLTNRQKYYYSAFVKNTAEVWSGAAFATGTPEGALKTIASYDLVGAGNLGPQTGAYGSSYSYKKKLTYGSLRKYSTNWLRFKHEWDIKVNSGPKYSSNQKHEYGQEDDLVIGFSKNIGGIASVTVTKIAVTAAEVRVEYKLVYTGGKALKISFRNKLSLRG